MTKTSLVSRCCFLSLALLSVHPTLAQNADGLPDDDVYLLDAFVVDGSQQKGYVATTSMSGTRLNQMVKDLRTGVDTSNIQQVMDGDLDRFIHAWLRAGCPTSRNNDIKIED